jgi:hypothetical protein
VLHSQAEVHLDQLGVDNAEALLDEAAAVLGQSPSAQPRVWGTYLRGLVALARGRPDHALELLDAAERGALAMGDELVVALARLHAAVALAHQGDGAEAASVLAALPDERLPADLVALAHAHVNIATMPLVEAPETASVSGHTSRTGPGRLLGLLLDQALAGLADDPGGDGRV